MPTIDELARRFMAEADTPGQFAHYRIERALTRALPDLEAQATRAAERVRAMQADGEPSQAAVYAAQRSRAIADQVRAEVDRLTRAAYPDIKTDQMAAVRAGTDDGGKLIKAAGASRGVGFDFERAPLEAVSALTGGLGDDGPLAELLQAIGPDTYKRVSDRLTAGMLAGVGPRAIAATMRREGLLPAIRAERIARTETIRAYRASSIATYAANSDVVKGYRRHADKSIRTCPMCLALDGKEYATAELLAIHPLCRCAVVPIVKTFAEMGIAATEPPEPRAETGAEWFARQRPDVQAKILGPGGLADYARHRDLSRFVAVHDDPRWGPTLRRRPNGHPGEPIPLAKPGGLVVGPPRGGGPREFTGAELAHEVAGDMRALARAERVERDATAAYSRAEAFWRDIARDAYNPTVQTTHAMREAGRQVRDAGREGLSRAREAHRAATLETATIRARVRERLRERLEQDSSGARIRALPDTLADDTAWRAGSDRWRRLIGRHTVLEDTGRHGVDIRPDDPTGDGRSHFRPWDNTVKMAPFRTNHPPGSFYSTDATVVHELTHYLEASDPYVRRQVAAYYVERTRGERLAPLGQGYRDNETTRRDKFIDAYMGKDYTGRPGASVEEHEASGAHELLTMAIQHLDVQPEHLLAHDPDMFRWVVDLLGRRLP